MPKLTLLLFFLMACTSPDGRTTVSIGSSTSGQTGTTTSSGTNTSTGGATGTTTATNTATATNTTTSSLTQTITVTGVNDLLATLTPASTANNKIVLLFHAENSNKHEYDTYIASLNDLGLDTLAVDLPNGGTLFGYQNETVEELGQVLTDFSSLESAINDTISWTSNRYTTVYVTASSLSAAAAIEEIATDTRVSKLAVFSAPSITSGGEKISNFAPLIRIPFFVAAPSTDATDTNALLLSCTSNNITRETSVDGGFGTLLLTTTVVLDAYLTFLTP